MRVWSILLLDDAGGWVMGVVSTRDEAIEKLRAYEAEHGGAVLGDLEYGVGDDDALCTIPVLNGQSSDERFLIASHRFGEIDG